jgi:hypothetical protein
LKAVGKLTLVDRVVIRRRRSEGEKLIAIGADFGVTKQAVAKTCRGVRAPRRSVDPRVRGVFELVGAQLGLGSDWQVTGRRRGRPSRAVAAALRASALALRQLGLDEVDVGRLLFPAWPARVFPVFERAEVDLPAVRLAELVLAAVGGRA